MNLTAIIRKGEKQYAALCPEIDIVSQGHTVDEALNNLKEAVELYNEEVGIPDDKNNNEMVIANININEICKSKNQAISA
ncbi:MAG: type II toxin-antitoxin system HicB family antitoxin [Candidatus Aenigmarchaeota archaeon]|nr:type II toxin-antitoxin system HicB family antitoxin [Candidatus Aenigmarchaeota archaeon]